MERLYTELKRITENDIRLFVEKSKDISKFSLIYNYFTEGLTNLLNVEPHINNDYVCCIHVKDFDIDFDKNNPFEMTVVADCFQILHDELKDYAQGKSSMVNHYDMEMSGDWADFLGSYVYIDKDTEISYNESLLHIVDALLFSGNSLEQRNEQINALEKEITQREKEGYHEFDDADALAESLEEDMTEEEKEEMRKIHKMWKENNKQIEEITDIVVKYNKEKLEDIYQDIIKNQED